MVDPSMASVRIILPVSVFIYQNRILLFHISLLVIFFKFFFYYGICTGGEGGGGGRA